MKRILSIAALCFVIFSPALWAIPSTINYQGTLREKGIPPTGPKHVIFRITDLNGTQVYWSSGQLTVNVVNGLFSAQITPTGVAWETLTPYIEVSVEGQLLLPREPVNATVYALVSNSVVDNAITTPKLLDGAISTAKINDGSITTAKLADNAVTSAKLDPAIQSILNPPGMVVAYAGSAPPTGWLLCDGAPVSRTTYANLFAAIAITWGAGDGVNTFNLPDLRGRSPIGAGQGLGLSNRKLAMIIGEESHTLSSSELPLDGYVVNDPGHSHNITDRGHFHSLNTNSITASLTSGGGGGLPSGPGSGSNGINTSVSGSGITVDSHITNITVSVPNGGNAHTNMQPSAAVNFLIKY